MNESQKQIITCPECHKVTHISSKECPYCGYPFRQNRLKRIFNGAKAYIKRNSKLTKIFLGILACFLIFCGICINILPSVDKYLEKGEYNKAYEIASNKKKKDEVKIENIAAVECAYIFDGLKGDYSFDLKNAFYKEEMVDEKINAYLVLESKTKQEKSGKIKNMYMLFSWNEKNEEWEYFYGITDFKKLDIDNVEDLEQKTKNLLYNVTINTIKEVKKEGVSLGKKAIKRINKMAKNDSLNEIELEDWKMGESI